MVVAATTV